MAQIEIATTVGPRSVEGYLIGPFGVHRSWSDYELWEVTHLMSGRCFPWRFKKQRQAAAFARGVQPVLNWGIVKIGDPDGGAIVSPWLSGRPSPDQLQQITELAAKHSGVR